MRKKSNKNNRNQTRMLRSSGGKRKHESAWDTKGQSALTQQWLRGRERDVWKMQRNDREITKPGPNSKESKSSAHAAINSQMAAYPRETLLGKEMERERGGKQGHLHMTLPFPVKEEKEM